MSNIAQYSVSEFSKKIKRIVEDAFGYVKIKGEISGFKKAASGHLYFSLKEENDVISAVCFKDMAEDIDFELEDGLEIIAAGRVTTYGGRSNYQIIVEKVEISGLGAIMEMLEKRRKKLEQEGIFDEESKKELPYFPKKIGVITSSSGAVIKDILHRVEDRCPTEILVYNASVQGKNAARDVIKGVKFFSRMKKSERVDLLIIARGGGSVEDLLPFSDEALVREVFDCEIPVISAVGHETDFSLLDFVADLRAPTPTAAAEMATVVFDDLIEQMNYLDKRLEISKEQKFIDLRRNLDNLVKYIKSPKEFFAQILDRFNRLEKDLEFNKNFAFERKNEQLSRILITKSDIFAKISSQNQQIEHFSEILDVKSKNVIKNYEEKIVNFSNLLEAKHYKEILKRGFAMIKNKDGKLISSLKNVKIKEEIGIEMADGEFDAYVFNRKNQSEDKKEKNDDNFQPELI